MSAKKVEAEATVVRGRRKVRTGVVSSNKMEKTVVVKIVRRVQHPLYGKTLLKTQKFKAHVDENELGGKVDEGDTVEIVETRPLSKDKNWRVSKIIEKVK
ncbi:MAG: 30S ribosomal protein S17 [Fimbriimonadaceae bacterium]|nr:30S ribosomal protein S17 [Fimbriimonadaceae bacterium]